MSGVRARAGIIGLSAVLIVGVYAYAQQGNDTDVTSPPSDRTYLPIPQPEPPSFSDLNVRNVESPPPFEEVQPPEGAPNVVVILIDDLGFGATSTFGGPVETPSIDGLADGGIRFNHFHTTALCSPTRVALQTGHNHHAANAGVIMELATSFPGYTAVRPDSITPIAEIMRQNGYNTAAFGKYHETPPWEGSASGPFDRWPTGSGYDYFYGFIGGETNQYYPAVFEGTTRVEVEGGPEYHFTEDMTDHAIAWMRGQQSLTPNKPFYVYFAPGATHAPHHVPREWAERFDGQFDMGWDALREQILARQIEMGIVPEGTTLPPKPDDIRDWADLNDDERRLFTLQMEVFAGFIAHTDHQIGRLLDAIDAMGEGDNTLVIAILGDNGTSAEGGPVGLFNEMQYFNGVPSTVEGLLEHADEWGEPTTYPHMASGWAVATGAPFAWTKQMAADFGGTRNPMILRWPERYAHDDTVRNQFHHVIDVGPTVLEAAGIPQPTVVNGVVQRPMDGVSMLYAVTEPDAPERRTTQYFEMFGNRAIYHEGWLARAIHFYPWAQTPVNPLEEDVWELYDTTTDFSLTNDLAAEQPERLAELQAIFDQEAERNHVYPIDDRRMERFDPVLAGRPDLVHGLTSMTLYPGMVLSDWTFIDIKNKSFTITADLDLAEADANGVIIAQAGQFGGWALHLDEGVPVFTYNFVGMEHYRVRGENALGTGQVQLVADFAFGGAHRGDGGTMTLSAGGETLGSGQLPRTQAVVFSADETVGVGVDRETPVDPDYGHASENAFTGGAINSVTIEVHP